MVEGTFESLASVARNFERGGTESVPCSLFPLRKGVTWQEGTFESLASVARNFESGGKESGR